MAWVARVQEIVHEHAGGAPRQRSSLWEAELAATGRFGPLSRARFRQSWSSATSIACGPAWPRSATSRHWSRPRAQVLDEVSAAAAAVPRPGHERIEMPYTTHLVWCSARAAVSPPLVSAE